MRNLFYILVFFVFAQQSIAQQGNLFDFQIQRIDSVNYELQLQLTSPEAVQFIEIKLMERGQDHKIIEASLNKKRDGKYYLFLDGEENSVFPENMAVSFDHSLEGLDIEIDPLEEPTISVELKDVDFNILDSLQKTID